MTATAYNTLPYDCVLGYEFQPTMLATIASLYGFTPPPVAKARILDVGCGDGTHIIGIAQALPDSECVGIDYAAAQIERGQACIEAVGLHNVHLQTANLLDEAALNLGKFDYIMAHGFYSWVPQPVQTAFFKFCQQHLSSNGLVYLSYNTLPGWHNKNMVRDMMQYHVNPSASLAEQAQAARSIVQFAANLNPNQDHFYGQFLHALNEHLATLPDSYIVHEYLAEENHAIYFKDFIAAMNEFELDYIADIEFKKYYGVNNNPTIHEQLQPKDWLQQEQYVDFLFKREFRSSLLCRKGQRFNRQLQPEQISNGYFSAELSVSTSSESFITEAPLSFTHASGTQFNVNMPLVKAALVTLAEVFPKSVAFSDLFQAACQRLGTFPEWSLHQQLIEPLLQLYLNSLVEMVIEPFAFNTELSDQPIASPLARWQASQGLPVASLTCKTGQLDQLSLSLLVKLDGQHSKADLIEFLYQQWQQGAFTIGQPEEQAQLNETLVKDSLAAFIDNILTNVKRNALLINEC